MMAVYCLDFVIPQAGTLQRLFKGFIQISSALKHTFQSVPINYVLLTDLLKYTAKPLAIKSILFLVLQALANDGSLFLFPS